MNKRLLLLLSALLLTLLCATMAGAQEAETLTVEHELGSAEVPVGPKKVVVFDFGTLDSIDALGIDGEMELALPKSNVPEYLSKYAGDAYTNAGDIKEPDLEAIFTFEPDVIFIAGRQSAAYEELAAIAPTVYVNVDAANYMADYEKNVTLLGQLFQQEDAVAQVLEEQKAKIAEVVEKSKATDDRALIILTNDGSISAYGSGSRFGIIHDLLMVKVADDNIEASTHGQEVGFEYIAQVDPDILFVVDRTAVVGGDQEGSATLDNELVAGTKAAQNGKIVYLDPNYWYLSGGGIESVSKMIDDVAGAL